MSSKFMTVKQYILDMLEQMKDGELLPGRNQLAESCKVSRVTVERAISELANEGYLYSRRGSGTYARIPESKPSISVQSPFGDETWALLISNILSDLYPFILRGVEDYAQRIDCNLLICNTDNNAKKQDEYICKLLGNGVKSFIIVPAIDVSLSTDAFAKLRQHNAHVVTCMRPLSYYDCPGMLLNSFQAGFKATNHLLLQGCRRIAFVALPKYSSTADRLQGYLTALNMHGIAFDERLSVYDTSLDANDNGYDITRRLLEQVQDVDGIFAFNDRVAVGAYRAIEEFGLCVGKDIKLIGCDNTQLCYRTPINLSSVSFDLYRMGELAASYIHRMNSGEDSTSLPIQYFDAEIIPRESSI